ncbi:MAG: hypothetical protein U0V48_04670 [Anaerolineales bacterium]
MQIQSTFSEMIRHRYLLLIFAALFALAVWFIFWRMKNAERLVNFITTAGAFMGVFSIAVSVQHDLVWSIQSARRGRGWRWSRLPRRRAVRPSARPMFTSSCSTLTSAFALEKYFNYDRSAFTQKLEGLVSALAQCAQSNYPVTAFCDFHLLSYDYPSGGHALPALFESGRRDASFAGLPGSSPLRNRSTVIFLLPRMCGFRAINCSRQSGLFGSLASRMPEVQERREAPLARLALDIPALIGFDLAQQRAQFYEHYQQTYFILNELKRLPEGFRAKLVFAHFAVPHPPFIVARMGSVGMKMKWTAIYRMWSLSIRRSLIQLPRSSPSQRFPVIILMSDAIRTRRAEQR